MFVLCLAIILTATILSLANSESIHNLEMQGIYDVGQINIPNSGKIFHKSQNKVHIDFKAVNEKLIKVQVEKDGTIVLKDTVNDLSNNVIYEINLEKFGKGEYTVALTTSLKRKISENFVVQ